MFGGLRSARRIHKIMNVRAEFSTSPRHDSHPSQKRLHNEQLMSKQLNIFGSLLLSLAAGMTASEVVSHYFERTAAEEPRIQAQSSPTHIASEVRVPGGVVN